MRRIYIPFCNRPELIYVALADDLAFERGSEGDRNVDRGDLDLDVARLEGGMDCVTVDGVTWLWTGSDPAGSSQSTLSLLSQGFPGFYYI